MSRPEADGLKQIRIKDIVNQRLINGTGFSTQSITFNRFGQSTGTMGLTTDYENSEPVKITLSYTMVDTDIKRTSSILITTTPCNYGGKRHFFQCPGCSNKCYKIYFLNTYFRCRNCHNLTYESNNRTRSYRKLDRLMNCIDFYDTQTPLGKLHAKAYRYPMYKGKPTRSTIKLFKYADKAPTQEQIDEMLSIK